MGHIKITDLSVGDWVMYEGNHRKVAFIDGVNRLIRFALSPNFVGTGAIEPIPLTQEILEKNGFVKNEGYDEWNIGTWRTPYLLGVSLERPSITVKWNGSSIFIDRAKYIHELQHALRLAKNAKEIEL
jgi:hypothetical protein